DIARPGRQSVRRLLGIIHRQRMARVAYPAKWSRLFAEVADAWRLALPVYLPEEDFVQSALKEANLEGVGINDALRLPGNQFAQGVDIELGFDNGPAGAAQCFQLT